MKSFEEIYEKHLKDVYKFLLRLCGDASLAEELTQVTFAKAFENLDTFRGTCKMTVWLCQIAKHEYYAYYKKHKRIVPESSVQIYLSHDSESIEQKLIDKLDHIRIHEILHDLPEPYKEVFTLRIMGELAFKDISRLFRKTESWAKVTYYRAKCMIIEQLGGGSNE